MKSLLCFLCLALMASCGLTTQRPTYQMSLAAEAFLAAKESNAETLAPKAYRKAEIYYLKAKSAYRRKYFNKAKQYALLSQKYAEKAEFDARLKAVEEG